MKFSNSDHWAGKRYHDYRKSWNNIDKNNPGGFPLQIDLDLQDACNLRCPHCHQSGRARTWGIMPMLLLKKIISESVNYKLCSINFGSASEPTLRPMLLAKALDLVEYQIMDVFIHTNGTTLTYSDIDVLLEYPITHLCFSIDATTPETYLLMRSRAGLQSLKDKILYIMKERNGSFPRVRVSFCATPDNHHEANQFKKFWKNKVDIVDIQSYRKSPDILHMPDNFERDKFACDEPFKRMMIWPDGMATLCCGYRNDDVQIGNVAIQSIRDIWNGDKINHVRDLFRAGKEPLTCRVCYESTYKIKEPK